MFASALTLSFNLKVDTHKALADTKILTSKTLCIICLQYEWWHVLVERKAPDSVQCLHGIFEGYIGDKIIDKSSLNSNLTNTCTLHILNRVKSDVTVKES
jgi:hypothetical protein